MSLHETYRSQGTIGDMNLRSLRGVVGCIKFALHQNFVFQITFVLQISKIEAKFNMLGGAVENCLSRKHASSQEGLQCSLHLYKINGFGVLWQARIQKEEAKKVAVQVDENVPAPSPRCNGTVRKSPCSLPCCWKSFVYFSCTTNLIASFLFNLVKSSFLGDPMPSLFDL